MHSDYWELFFSVLIPTLLVAVVAALVMAAPTVDLIIFGR